MNQQELPYKTWLKQYANGTIKSGDKKRLMHAIAEGHIDAVLEDALDEQWAAAMQEGAAQGAALPFEQSAVYRTIQSEVKAPKAVPLMRRWGWAAAAAVAGLLLLGIAWRYGAFATSDAFLSQVPAGYLQQSNTAAQPRVVNLPDGSAVTLNQGASLYYPSRFEGGMRQVYLQGNAFFEVTHLDGIGFHVHGRAVSAEVLGTSFWVRQDDALGRAEVEVRTGKVRVQALTNSGGNNIAASPVVVLPNQQVAYQAGQGQLQLLLADSLLPLHTTEAEQILQSKSALYFGKATRLQEVLEVLSAVYGVDIQVSTPELNNCLVTGDLSEQELLKSIEMICLSIGAKHEVKGATILISGPGCSLQ